MGKINKYCNLYNTDEELIRKVDEHGILRDLSFKEVQDLVDKLGTEKNEFGNLKDPEGFNKASAWLMQMYKDPKYKNELETFVKELHDRLRNNKNDSTKALGEVNKELESLRASKEVCAAGISPANGETSERASGDVREAVHREIQAGSPTYNVNSNESEYVDYEQS